MKVTESTVRKLDIRDVAGLDPVTVFLEDFGAGRGRITIECFGESWSAGWAAMGDRTVSQFFIDAHDSYIAGKLSAAPDWEYDYARLVVTARRHLVARRREKAIGRHLARDLYDAATQLDVTTSSELDQDLMLTIFGEDWSEHIPTRPSSTHLYLCRIIRAVREALGRVEYDCGR